jgi:hypothetical protein
VVVVVVLLGTGVGLVGFGRILMEFSGEGSGWAWGILLLDFGGGLIVFGGVLSCWVTGLGLIRLWEILLGSGWSYWV